MGRSACCEKLGLKKGPWTPEEDQKLLAYIDMYGHGSWRALPAKAGLQRCGKSCRLRWTNYLRPDIKRGKFSLQEEQTIIQLHALLGNRWSAIANHLAKRTDNEIKNYWNTHLKKRLTKMGIDPVTHKPRTDGYSSDQSKDVANLSHMAQWESARLEAEARLVRESKQLQASPHNTIVTTYHQSLHAREISRLLITDRMSSQSNDQPPAPPCPEVLKAWQGSFYDSSLAKTNGMIYPMMFATDDLESPTSTLSFCDNMLPVPTSCKFGWMNQGSLVPAAANVTNTCAGTSTAAGNVSWEPAGGSKTGNGTEGIIQEYCNEQCDNIASWSTKPNANNDGNDAIIIDNNGMIMAAYSVEGCSWQLEAAVNGSTVPADGSTAVGSPGFRELINLDQEGEHNHINMVFKDERFPENEDGHNLQNSNETNYWNSILINLVNASPSSIF